MKTGRNHCARVAVAATALAVFSAAAFAQEERPPEERSPFIDGWSLATGVDFTSGDFGLDTGDTDILYYYGQGDIDIGRLRLRATIPWIRIEGPESVVGGVGDTIVIDPDAEGRRSSSGLGDVVLQAGYLIGSTRNPLPFLEAVVKVKLPTADEDKGLGTGKTDVSFQADIFDRYGPVTPFATFGWRHFGDPELFELENTFFAGGGLSIEATDEFSFGASLDWREASSRTSSDLLEVSPFATLSFGRHWRVTGYGVIGLEDGSPDAGGGLFLKFRH